MAERVLRSAPRLPVVSAKALLHSVPVPARPGRHRPSGDRDMPVPVRLTGVVAVPTRLAAYRRVCGFAAGPDATPASPYLPATYPHVLAFPLHLTLMSDRRFPFAPLGLVHIANTITQYRRVAEAETMELAVAVGEVGEHPRGRLVTLHTEAMVGQDVVWQEASTFLSRSRRAPTAVGAQPQPEGPLHAGRQHDRPGPGLAPVPPAEPVASEPSAQVWDLPADLGRRYAAVSGDLNPIHVSWLTARAFGFRSALAHGMWTLTRSLAALAAPEDGLGLLSDGLPVAYEVYVVFRKPLFLPGQAVFTAQRTGGEGSPIDFRVASPERGHVVGPEHLTGRLTPW